MLSDEWWSWAILEHVGLVHFVAFRLRTFRGTTSFERWLNPSLVAVAMCRCRIARAEPNSCSTERHAAWSMLGAGFSLATLWHQNMPQSWSESFYIGVWFSTCNVIRTHGSKLSQYESLNSGSGSIYFSSKFFQRCPLITSQSHPAMKFKGPYVVHHRGECSNHLTKSC